MCMLAAAFIVAVIITITAAVRSLKRSWAHDEQEMGL